MRKRLFALFLTACMIISILPAAVMAASPAKPASAFTGTLAEDLSISVGNLTLNERVHENDHNHKKDELGVELRNGLLAREETVTVYLRTTEQTEDDLLRHANEMFAYAVEYNSSMPAEGDYLRWNVGTISVSIDGYSNGNWAYLTYVYKPVYTTTTAQENAVTDAVGEILAELDVDNAIDEEKVRAIYDYLCTNISYDGPYTKETPLYKFSAYAAVTEGSAVSFGIAHLFYRLALELELDARMVCGELNGQDHCWNIVKIGNLYYNVDASLDCGSSAYSYYLLNDESMTGHVRYDDYNSDAFHSAHPMDSLNFTDPEVVQEEGRFGNEVNWTLGHRGTLTVTGSGNMFDYEDADASPLVRRREKVTSIIIEDGVTSVGNFVFYGCQPQRVTLGSDITKIGYSAFRNCTDLREIVIPTGVNYIGKYAFQDCSKLHTVTLPDTFGSLSEGAFSGCDSLTHITIPTSVEEICAFAFDGSGLTSIDIPESVLRIGDNVFCGAPLTTVTIPASVTAIGADVFNDCRELREILVADGSESFASVDGVLYDAAVTTIVGIPEGKTGTLTIPDTVTAIPSYGFSHTWYLTEVTVGDGVTTLEDGAFWYSRLNKITLGRSVSFIGGSAFANCKSLTEIYFTGNAPTIESYAFDQVKAKAYYPAADETWTDSTMQQYAGIITWIPYCPDGHAAVLLDATDPTCRYDGYTGDKYCENCGELLEQGTVIPALGHSYEDGICTVCGAIEGAVELATPEILSCYSKLQTSVKTTWTPVDSAEGYELYRTSTPDDEDSWTKVKTITDGTADRYTNQGLTEGLTYYYKVRAYATDIDGQRVYSLFSNVHYMPAAVVFNGPYSNSISRIRVLWNEVGGAHGYQIWRKVGDGDYSIVKTIGDKGNTLTNNQGATTSYSNTGLTAGETYTYKMRAFMITEDGRKVFGAYSDEVNVAVTPTYTVVTAECTAPGTVKLTWNEVYGASGYQIWMDNTFMQDYEIVKTITDGSITAYTKYDLEPADYQFKIRAYVEADGRKTFADFSPVAHLLVD